MNIVEHLQTGTSGPPDAEVFKAAFRRWPTGVGVVTAVDAGGPFGLTVSSLASVSAEPPVVSLSVSGRSTSATRLLAAHRFSVHVLPASRADVAIAFASADGRRFASDHGWRADESGEPVLESALVRLACALRTLVPVGESRLLAADVQDIRLGPDATPLVHVDRTYRRPGAAVPTDLSRAV